MRPRSKSHSHESPPAPPPSPDKGAAAPPQQQSEAATPPGHASVLGAAPSLLHEPAAARLRAAAAADAAAPRADFLWAPPCWLHKPLASLLEDPRDLPILFLLLNVLLTTAPAAAALFALFPPAARPLPHWLGAAYLLASFAAYLARFMLSLHYSQHRRLFRRGEAAAAGGAGGGVGRDQRDRQRACTCAGCLRAASIGPSLSGPNPCPHAHCRPVAPRPGRPGAAGAPVWRALGCAGTSGARRPAC